MKEALRDALCIWLCAGLLTITVIIGIRWAEPEIDADSTILIDEPDFHRTAGQWCDVPVQRPDTRVRPPWAPMRRDEHRRIA